MAHAALAGFALRLPLLYACGEAGTLAWRFSSESFTAVPLTGTGGFLPAIPRPVGYSLGISPTFPQAVSPPTLTIALAPR